MQSPAATAAASIAALNPRPAKREYARKPNPARPWARLGVGQSYLETLRNPRDTPLRAQMRAGFDARKWAADNAPDIRFKSIALPIGALVVRVR